MPGSGGRPGAELPVRSAAGRKAEGDPDGAGVVGGGSSGTPPSAAALAGRPKGLLAGLWELPNVEGGADGTAGNGLAREKGCPSVKVTALYGCEASIQPCGMADAGILCELAFLRKKRSRIRTMYGPVQRNCGRNMPCPVLSAPIPVCFPNGWRKAYPFSFTELM